MECRALKFAQNMDSSFNISFWSYSYNGNYSIILVLPVLPVIVPFPIEKPAHMDQFLSITCAVSDGDLPLNIFWTFNNQPITSDSDVSISKLGKRTSILTIDSVNGHHSGQYGCHGKNEAGSTSYSTEPKVIGVFPVTVLFTV